MIFDLLHIVDIVALCWLFILSPRGAHPCPSQSTSFWTTSCCTTNKLLTSCCVCVICWFMYRVDLVTMEMVAWWLEVTHVLLNIYIILYLVTNCYRIFFFLNDSWIRNNKWSWLLYSLCWLFFLYNWSFSGIWCINEDQILAVHKAILLNLDLVRMYMYCDGFLKSAWNTLSSVIVMVSSIYNEYQF